MKIPWPITVIASIIAFGWLTIATIMGQLQSIPAGLAPAWPTFILSHAPFVLIGTMIFGLIAWIVERNIRRSRSTG
jgi:hypothetical protein